MAHCSPSKVVYFVTNGKEDCVKFSANNSRDVVKDLFRSSAAAGPHDILKLYTAKGGLVGISPLLESNTPEDRYTLEIVGSTYDHVAHGIALDIESTEARLCIFENGLSAERSGSFSVGGGSEILLQVKRQLDILKQKLRDVEHLSWIGLSKELNSGGSVGCSLNTQIPAGCVLDSQISAETRNKADQVLFKRFKSMGHAALSTAVREQLKMVTFNNWHWEDDEMLILLQQMFVDLQLIEKFNIERLTLQNWLYELYRGYSKVPFHNFKHCFMVSQMMYGLIYLLKLDQQLDDLDILVLLVSSMCHDLDHPGYNNTYQINAGTELAIRYNDMSPLENHHCSVAFRILGKDECNILKGLPTKVYRRARQSIIRCILATDMTRHKEILSEFNSLQPRFNLAVPRHKEMLMMILIKCADISNECRPMEVAEPWIDCLLQEFFNQSDAEKLEGLPVLDSMDREKVDKPASQIGFIQIVLLPLFESLGALFPQVQEPLLVPLKDAFEYYSQLVSRTNAGTKTNGVNHTPNGTVSSTSEGP